VKTLGIIGGIAPPSTVDYYQRIVAGYREQRKDGSFPSIVINSIDLSKMLSFVFADELDELTEFLLPEVERLARAGADFGLFASNTPHIVFDRVAARCPIPLISIVECACAAAKKMGLKKLGLMGLRTTMEGKFYPETFSRSKITLVAPAAEEREYVHDKYMNELIPGNFLAETRERIFAIIAQMKKQHGIEGVVLAGTELPLLLRGSNDAGIPLLDTTQLHVNAAVERLLE
jgi:aspartate racemase